MNAMSWIFVAVFGIAFVAATTSAVCKHIYDTKQNTNNELKEMRFGELAEKSIDYQMGYDIGGKRMGDFLIKEIQKEVKDGGIVRKSDLVRFLQLKEQEWLRHCHEFGMGKNRDTGTDQFK